MEWYYKICKKSSYCFLEKILSSKSFFIISLKFSSILSPLRRMILNFLSNFNHSITFLNQPLFIGSSLPHNLITIKTINKLRFCFYIIMPRNFRGEITVDLDDLDLLIILWNFLYVVIGDLTSWIPFCSEIDYYIGMAIDKKVLI